MRLDDGLPQGIARTLFGMFMADARLTVATLVLVLLVHLARHWTPSDLAAGALLLLGCLAILFDAALHAARRRRPA